MSLSYRPYQASTSHPSNLRQLVADLRAEHPSRGDY